MSIRAFTPVWVFLYVLQFLLMPLIAQDYWVSNLFGNSMYLLALSYYFVIMFLGYNGTSTEPEPLQILPALHTSVNALSSSTLPKSNGSTTVSGPGAGSTMADQLIHL